MGKGEVALSAETVGIVAGFMSGSGYLLYVFDMKARGIKPNRATWFVWALVNIIIAVGYVESGATDSKWTMIIYAIGGSVIFIASIFWGEGGWKAIEWESTTIWVYFNEVIVASKRCIIGDDGSWYMETVEGENYIVMYGKFTGETGSGMWEYHGPNPDNPHPDASRWGTWTADKYDPW